MMRKVSSMNLLNIYEIKPSVSGMRGGGETNHCFDSEFWHKRRCISFENGEVFLEGKNILGSELVDIERKQLFRLGEEIEVVVDQD